MPASAGRVRMPHNNRMSTSASLKTHAIWQTAIGHDPYANEEEKQDTVTEADREKAKSVMELARSQNLTDGAKRDNFTAQMYQGLKQPKKRRTPLPGSASDANHDVDPHLQGLLEAPSSSSEDEFVEVEVNKEKKKKSSSSDKKSRKRHRKEASSDSESDSSESESDSEEERRRRRRRRRKRKESKRRKHKHRRSHSHSSDSDDDSEERRRRRRRKESRRDDDRKKSRRKEED